MPALSTTFPQFKSGDLKQTGPLGRLLRARDWEVTFEVQGLNATIDHFAAVAEYTEELTRGVVQVAGQWIAETAKQIHEPNIDTGATRDSIDGGRAGSTLPIVFSGGGSTWAVIGAGDEGGASDPQALLLEIGFIHTGGQWIQFPYLFPAADSVAPAFFDGMRQVASVADQLRHGSGRVGSGMNDTLARIRNQLYSTSKFLGDLQIFGPIPGVGGFRTGALSLARVLGDVDAVMRGAMSTRILRRVEGRFTAGGLSTTRSAVLSGPPSGFAGGAQRIYNRLLGGSVGGVLRRGA